MAYEFRIKNGVIINDTQAVDNISTDGTLSGDADTTLVTEQAIKEYVDTTVDDSKITGNQDEVVRINASGEAEASSTFLVKDSQGGALEWIPANNTQYWRNGGIIDTSGGGVGAGGNFEVWLNGNTGTSLPWMAMRTDNTVYIETGSQGGAINLTSASETLPYRTIADIDNGDDKQITTKEYVNADKNWINFNPQSPAPDELEGRLFYDDTTKSMAYYNDIAGVTQNIGRELWMRGVNNTGDTLTNGTVIMVRGATNGVPNLVKADADEYGYDAVLGVVTEDILDGDEGEATYYGVVNDFDTSHLIAGAPVFLDTTAGLLTATRPTFPAKAIIVGGCTVSDAVNGNIIVIVKDDTYNYEFDGCIIEKHDTEIRVEADNEVYMYVENMGGGDLIFQLGSGIRVLDCTTVKGYTGLPTETRARIQLIQGTAESPQEQIVHLELDVDGVTPILHTVTDYPDHPFALVSRVSIRDFATVTTEGADSDRIATSSIQHDGRGRISYLTERWGVEPARWTEGVTPSATIQDLATDVMDLSVLEGYVYQTHRQHFPALSVVTDGIYIGNATNTPDLANYQKVNNLLDVCGYTSGNASRNTSSRGHLVIYGLVNKTDGECKLMVNLPTDLYGGNDGSAYVDYNGYADYTVPSELTYTAFLIARIQYDIFSTSTVKFIDSDGNTSLLGDDIINLLGTPIGISGGSAGTASFIPTLSQVLAEGADANYQDISTLSKLNFGTFVDNVSLELGDVGIQYTGANNSPTHLAVQQDIVDYVNDNVLTDGAPLEFLHYDNLGNLTSTDYITALGAKMTMQPPVLELLPEDGDTLVSTGLGWKAGGDTGTGIWSGNTSNNTKQWLGAYNMGSSAESGGKYISMDSYTNTLPTLEFGNSFGTNAIRIGVDGYLAVDGKMGQDIYSAPTLDIEYVPKKYVDDNAVQDLQAVTDISGITTNDIQVGYTATGYVNQTIISDDRTTWYSDQGDQVGSLGVDNTSNVGSLYLWSNQNQCYIKPATNTLEINVGAVGQGAGGAGAGVVIKQNRLLGDTYTVPVEDQEYVMKKYVDDNAGGGGGGYSVIAFGWLGYLNTNTAINYGNVNSTGGAVSTNYRAMRACTVSAISWDIDRSGTTSESFEYRIDGGTWTTLNTATTADTGYQTGLSISLDAGETIEISYTNAISTAVTVSLELSY